MLTRPKNLHSGAPIWTAYATPAIPTRSASNAISPAVLAFSGNGITFSRIAAEVIRATLSGQTDPEADLFAFR